jgi:hypothetical protein
VEIGDVQILIYEELDVKFGSTIPKVIFLESSCQVTYYVPTQPIPTPYFPVGPENCTTNDFFIENHDSEEEEETMSILFIILCGIGVIGFAVILAFTLIIGSVIYYERKKKKSIRTVQEEIELHEIEIK